MMQDYQGASSLCGWRGMRSSRHSGGKQKDFSSLGKWKSPGMFPAELSAAARSFPLLSQFPPALPSPTHGQPLSGGAKLTQDPPPAALLGSPSEVTVGPVPPGAHSPARGYRRLSCCLHRNPRGNGMRALLSTRISKQSPSPDEGRHARGYKDTVDHVTEELFLLL